MDGPNFSVSSPAIAEDGTIYIGGDQRMYALDPDNSEEREIWSYSIDGPIRQASPAVGEDGTIYLPNGDSFNLYAITPDGEEEWTTQGNRLEYAIPAIGDDGVIYAGSCHDICEEDDCKKGNGIMFAFNPDGSERWRTYVLDCIDARPAIGDNGLLFAPSDPLEDVDECVDQCEAECDEDCESCEEICEEGAEIISPGIFYAIGTSSEGYANSSWPKAQKDDRSTGLF